MNLKALSLPILSFGICAASQAATLIVTNNDFTINTTSGTQSATGWTDIEVGGGTVYYNPSEASGVDNIAYIPSSGNATSPNFAGIWQNLSIANGGLNTSTYNSYTISFDAGFRDDISQTGTIQLRVALVDLGLDGVYQSSDSILASQTFSRSGDGTPGQSAMTGVMANLNIASASTNQVALVFLNENTGSTFQQTAMIDNVSITAVPEPSIALLGGLGLLGLLRRRR